MEGAETLRKTQRTEGGALVAFAQELAHNAYGCDRQLKRANETELARIGQISDCLPGQSLGGQSWLVNRGRGSLQRTQIFESAPLVPPKHK